MGVVVGAWVGDEGGYGGGGRWGDDSADGDLVLVVAVERADVEGGVDGFLDPVRGGGEDVAG